MKSRAQTSLRQSRNRNLPRALSWLAVMSAFVVASSLTFAADLQSSDDALVAIVHSEVVRISALVTANPTDGAAVNQLELKAFPAAKILMSRFQRVTLKRDQALVAVRLMVDLATIDSGEYEAELISPLRNQAALRGLIKQCPADGMGSSSSILPAQSELTRLNLKPLSTADICQVAHLIEDLNSSGNG